ncbi:MAG: phosphate ABC transporter substrate-binding protein [Candidatus Competibacteraceae bacterium]|nr:phosphate ABC transporter substrate-binding protein [Candidatus Competibacteraceae bacterium]MCP5124824.1 phosphate ABC transporter substrate-binding protein [Gammaproteobacteria bacterium]
MKVLNIVGLMASTLLFFSHAVADGLESFNQLEGNILIAGGTAHLPIMYELKHRIEEFNPNIHILVRGGGSTFGIEQIGKGLIDIGNAGRLLKPKEQQHYDLQTIPLAIDAIAVVVHPSNPISNLSTDTVRKIYAGEITNWKQVGGDDSPISLYDRNAGSGTRSVFLKKVMPNETPTTTANIIDDHDKMKVVVSWDKNALGYMSLGHVDESKVKPLALNGVVPNFSNAQSGKYILARKIYIYLPADITKVSELTRRFVEYLLSPDGAEIIRHNGYIPVK